MREQMEVGMGDGSGTGYQHGQSNPKQDELLNLPFVLAPNCFIPHLSLLLLTPLLDGSHWDSTLKH